MADAAASTAPSTAPLTFAAFLEKMRCVEASDIVKAIKAFLTEFATLQPDADRDSERVQVRRCRRWRWRRLVPICRALVALHACCVLR